MLWDKKVEWGSTSIEWNNNVLTWDINIFIDNKNLTHLKPIKWLWIKQSFIDSLESIEFSWFTLSKLFVWPVFYFISWSEEKNIDWSLDTFLTEKNKTCFIKWVDLSWKTSIWKKIFLESLSVEYYPILINWSSINKWNLKFDDILKKEFDTQYDWDFQEYKLQTNKIIIVDNYHLWINDKFINFCKDNFLKIIYLISEDDFVMYFKDEESYIDFDIYSIWTFNNSRKHDLIFNWLKKDYQTSDEVYSKNFDLIENRIEDITSKNHMVPMYPFYLLSIIQAFENVNTRDLTMTSYWHCYYALIILQFDKKSINKNERDYCLNFLKHLAYYIYKQNWYDYDGISNENYVKFKVDYNNKFTMMTQSTLNKLQDEQYSIFREKNWKIKFEFEYIYYYFVWKYIAEEENNIKMVENLCETIHKKSSSNILIFTIHHSSNNKLLEEIQLHCITIFDDYKITMLSNEDTKFINDLIKKLPESILSNKSVSENRKIEQKVKDKHENTYKELTDNEIEENKEITDLSKAFKVIEVLWQILKNRAGSLEKSKQEELLFDIENLWLRLMSYLLNTINSEDFYKSIERMIEVFEISKWEKSFISDSEKRKKIEEFIQNMWLRTILWLLFKIFQSVAIEQLLDLQKSITRKNPYPSYKLLYSLFNLNYNKFKYDELKNLYNNFEDEKNFLALRTMSFFIQIYMNNHYIKFDERQKLHHLLWIKKYIPNKTN